LKSNAHPFRPNLFFAAMINQIKIALFAAAWLASLRLLRAAEPARPNVIFILTDDSGRGDWSSYGGKQGATPNVDRLAAEGTKFTRAYVAAPICSASRAAFTTGMFPGELWIDCDRVAASRPDRSDCRENAQIQSKL
jgi:hypothetical protein